MTTRDGSIRTPAERTAQAMSLVQLSMVAAAAPERRVLWTQLEQAAAAELDVRLAAKHQEPNHAEELNR